MLHSRLCVGISETELVSHAKKLFKLSDADQPAFPLIVAFGPHSATVHHSPTDTKLKKRDVVLIDIGCRVNGFCSDLSRTFIFGTPSKLFTKLETAVLNAHAAAISTLTPGLKATPCNLVDAAARKVITKAGFGKFFTHTTGHGIGKKIHQRPSISQNSTDNLKPNTAITIEPGIYLPNRFGYRHEDTLLITKSGYNNLTSP